MEEIIMGVHVAPFRLNTECQGQGVSYHPWGKRREREISIFLRGYRTKTPPGQQPTKLSAGDMTRGDYLHGGVSADGSKVSVLCLTRNKNIYSGSHDRYWVYAVVY